MPACCQLLYAFRPWPHQQHPWALTRVLLSSIFFMADSVVSGNLITECSSSLCLDGALQTNQGTERSTYGI